MPTPYSFLIVDDEPVSANLMKKFLEADGHDAAMTTSSTSAFDLIIESRPDGVLLDIMMPDIDGITLLKRLKADPRLDAMKVVMVSAKSYETDRNQAFDHGADGYVQKPIAPETFGPRLYRILEDTVDLRFWGIRGTLAVPGRETVEYGGNTSCVTMHFPDDRFFVFDAGTGIKEFSDYLTREQREPIDARLFISHPHWDHINGLPFFKPLYMQGNDFEILGPPHGSMSMRDLISGQMDGVYFPIKIKEFSANISFRDLGEESIQVNRATVRSMLLNHPGHCLGYRIDYMNRSLCYITDNELLPRDSALFDNTYQEKLTSFIQGADALITDSTYSDEEYSARVSWGHSSISRVVELAHTANIKSLYLFHHDPGQTDRDIDAKLETAQTLLRGWNSDTVCFAPREKDRFPL